MNFRWILFHCHYDLCVSDELMQSGFRVVDDLLEFVYAIEIEYWEGDSYGFVSCRFFFVVSIVRLLFDFL